MLTQCFKDKFQNILVSLFHGMIYQIILKTDFKSDYLRQYFDFKNDLLNYYFPTFAYLYFICAIAFFNYVTV